MLPQRRGVGFSEGTYPQNFSTKDGDATYKARVHAEDILPVLEWIKTRSELDASRVVMSGQSAGGYSTMYISSLNPSGVIGGVNFSGGRTDQSSTSAASDLNRMMVNGFGEFGKTTSIPMLWIFAANDSRYSVNTINSSHQAFVEAGGKAQLLLAPAIDGDGHYVHQKPEVWRSALKDYLARIGAIKKS